MTFATVGVAMQMLAPPTPTSDVAITNPVLVTPIVPAPPAVAGLTRDTGIDTQPNRDFGVYGADLGIPFTLPDGSTGYLFGDTFTVAGPFLDIPPGMDYYRPQVLLKSNATPAVGQPIIFDGAAGLSGTGEAPELLHNEHSLPNDGVSLPNGDVILSYQKIVDSQDTTGVWRTDNAGLAVSHDGGNTFQLAGPVWQDNADNTDPYQMWSMQRDGDWVYIVSVRAGRQPGPMMLFRVPSDSMLDGNAYQYWNGTGWGDKAAAKPILTGDFGEPSLRKLDDGTWALAYTDYAGGPRIVTRTATSPTGPWSDPKVQLTWQKLPALYGGFIWPGSTPTHLVLMISTWQTAPDGTKHGRLIRYDVSHFVGAL